MGAIILIVGVTLGLFRREESRGRAGREVVLSLSGPVSAFSCTIAPRNRWRVQDGGVGEQERETAGVEKCGSKGECTRALLRSCIPTSCTTPSSAFFIAHPPRRLSSLSTVKALALQGALIWHNIYSVLLLGERVNHVLYDII